MSVFYIVYSFEMGMPTVKHHTYPAAVTEAERLAKKHSGTSFFVFKAVTVSTVNAVVTTALEE